MIQEFGYYTEDMLLVDFIRFSNKVTDIWETKKKCEEEGTIYIGG